MLHNTPWSKLAYKIYGENYKYDEYNQITFLLKWK